MLAQLFSHVRLFAARQTPLSMDYLDKNSGVNCHFLLQGNLPVPGIKPASPALAGRFFITEPPGKPIPVYTLCIK